LACRPQFIDEDTQNPVLYAEALSHPCLINNPRSQFIPNTIELGGTTKARLIILTGPNMGGKSTLLRQVCLAVILAQLGCYVPAASMSMTLVDRIFTRIGAHDNILAGQSTFTIELEETSKMLKEATPNSLVILDELGRGTSTFDGYSIAYSVLAYLQSHVRPLGLFSTHYTGLTKEWTTTMDDNVAPPISFYHMNCQVDPTLSNSVLFLYTLTLGVCPKSYGLNVARLAGIPDAILQRSLDISEQVESTHAHRSIASPGGNTVVASSGQRLPLHSLMILNCLYQLVEANNEESSHGSNQQEFFQKLCSLVQAL
jgi:DNA mismatch repair protein MSH6